MANFTAICDGVCGNLFIGKVVFPEGVRVLWIVIVGLGGLMAHFRITNALLFALAIVVIPLDFIRPPLFSVIGFLAHGEALELPILIVSVVILIAIVICLKAE